MWFTKIWKQNERTMEELQPNSDQVTELCGCVCVCVCVFIVRVVCVSVCVCKMCVRKIDKRVEIVTDSDTHGLKLQLNFS